MVLSTSYRTHTCGELRLQDVGKTVTITGWVQAARDKKHFAFVDLRDRYGITQVVVDNDCPYYDVAVSRSLGRETVVQVVGVVVERENKNPERATGDIEVKILRVKTTPGEVTVKIDEGETPHSLRILSAAKFPPLKIEDETDATEETCLKYRFLDLRRPIMQERLLLRSKVTTAIRAELCAQEFVEVETPILIKSTPEGARDFIVPYRASPGQFYALPQSPQTFKQLLMVGGTDRYFQIARCFRDEELRADRQPEFTQVDCEMSFVTKEDILPIFESMVRRVFKEVKNIELKTPFPRMRYKTAMEKYGIDKPDIRFEMFLTDLTALVQSQMAENRSCSVQKSSGEENCFGPFQGAGLIVGLSVPGGSARFPTGKALRALEKRARTEAGASCMVWVRCDGLGLVEQGAGVGEGAHPHVAGILRGEEDGQGSSLKLPSSVANRFSQQQLLGWAQACNAQPGDLLCVFAGAGGKNADATREICGKWRHIMGSELGLRPPDTFAPLWVVDFPLLEWSEEQKRWSAKHHPFTRCAEEDEKLLKEAKSAVDAAAEAGRGAKSARAVNDQNLAAAIEATGLLADCGSLRADAYDLVLNGVEVGGGSIRISDRESQQLMFELLGFSKEQATQQFGFLLSAFEYGVPPHGGLAFGLDRLCAILCNTNSIREVMAFPKNSMGRCVMSEAPGAVSGEQLEELGLVVEVRPGGAEKA